MLGYSFTNTDRYISKSKRVILSGWKAKTSVLSGCQMHESNTMTKFEIPVKSRIGKRKVSEFSGNVSQNKEENSEVAQDNSV